MKTETKISSIALVCALCAVVAAPAMAAAPVRSLGGAGTYSSASSAATSKATGSSATATRAGAIRVMPSTTKATSTTTSAKPVTTGTATTSTRVAATPRLSIGKYLADKKVIASTNKDEAAENEFVDKDDPLWGRLTDLPDRVDDLETGVGVLEEQVKALEGTIGNTDVVNLQTIVNDLQTNVNTIVTQLPADDAPVATAESVTQINNTVNTINTTIEQLQEQITKIEAGDNSVTVDGLVKDVETLQNSVQALQLDVLNVQGEFTKYALKSELEDAIKNSGDNTAAVAALRAEYEAKVAELDADIADLFAVFKDYYTKSEIDAQFKSINDWLTDERRVAVETALFQLNALIGAKDSIEEYATANELKAVVKMLEDITAPDGDGMVTKTEMAELDAALTKLIKDSDDALSVSILGDIQKKLETNYYTSAQVDALLDGYATNEDLTLVANSIPTKVTDLTDSDDYVTQEQLETAKAAVEAEITKQLEAGNFATAENLGKVSDALSTLEGNVYTKEQVNQKVAEVVGGLSAYVTFTKLAELNLETNADGSYKKLGKVAYLDEIDASEYVVENSITSEMIDSVSADKIEGQLAATQLNAGVELEENQIAMLSVDGDGNQVWVVYTVE